MLLGLLAAILWAGNQTRLERRAELSEQSASLAQHDAVRSLATAGSQRLCASVLREQPSIVPIALADGSPRLLATAGSPSICRVSRVRSARFRGLGAHTQLVDPKPRAPDAAAAA